MATDTERIVQLFFNRATGRHDKAKLAALRATLEATGARVILTECGPGNDPVIAAEASHVCALGGDGTIRHVARAVAQSGRPLPIGIYPSGTVNLIHREILSPLDLNQHAARLFASEAPGLHYAVDVNDTLFLTCASVGPDSRAVASLSPWLKDRVGRAAYVAALLKSLLAWRREAIRLGWDGGATVCEAFYVAKGRYFAGPWSLAPEAALAQPILHVIALEKASRKHFARFAWALFRGKPVEQLPGTTAFTCTAFTATSAAPLPVQADGDIVTALPAQFRLRPEPIAFF